MTQKKEQPKGVTCISCNSVLFSIKDVYDHLRMEPRHNYYKYGDGEFVWHLKQLIEERQYE